MIERFARHKTLANLLMLIFCVLGLATLPGLRRETFPDIDVAEVQITVRYPGATAEEVEESICERVEDAISGVKFVKEVRSVATENVATITVEMEEGAQELKLFEDDLASEVDAIDDFPEGVEDPIVTQLGLTSSVLVLLVSGPMDTAGLKEYCEALKRRIRALPDVSLVKLGGFSDRQYRVELSEARLRRYGLTASDVSTAIGRQGVDVPAGALSSRDRDTILRFVEKRRTPAELEALIVQATPDGGEVQLGDVARVVDVFEDEEVKNLDRDRRAGVLTIEKTTNQDSIRVANAVKEFIELERRREPLVNITVSQDGSTLVWDRIQLVITNAWQGLLLVFLTMWLFFNLRLSFWVVMSLPVSFLGAFFVMPSLDLTINMMTLVGMLLATGLLMDDGIVIAENVARHLSMGKPAMKAASEGVQEIMAGVISSFLTTICVLGPLAFLSGTIGQIMEAIPIILIAVMGISLVEAFLILPAHLGHSLHHVDLENPGKVRRGIDRFMDWMRERVAGTCVDQAIAHRYLFVGAIVGTFIVAIGMVTSGRVAFVGFPNTEGDTVQARILLPQGTPLAITENAVAKITAALERIDAEFAPQQPQGQPLVKNYQVQFNVNADAFESGAHVATVTVDLLGVEQRSVGVREFIARWRAEVGLLEDVLSLTYGEPSAGPAGRAIEMRFQSADLADAKQAAQAALAWFDRFEGVSNLTDDLRKGKQEYRIRLRDGATGMGLDVASIANQVAAAFQGTLADELQAGAEQFEVVAQLEASDRRTMNDFWGFHVALADGTQVPLSAIVEVETKRGWARIARVNGQRAVTLIGEIDPRVANTSELTGMFRKEALPKIQEEHPDVEVVIAGETAESGDTGASMLFAFAIGMLGVFSILSYQFESWIEPLIIMGAIPMALIGVILGHYLLGVELSIPSILGFVSLAGVVVNDSILLMTFLKEEYLAGASPEESARQASRLRFRAILLTSATTIAGLVPLMMERSSQAQTLVPLAVSICFGMASSTVLVLLVIPCVYVILCDLGVLGAKADEAH